MTTNPTSLSAPEIWNDPIIKHMAFVFSRQDDDEQDRETTKYKNGRGFSAVDAGGEVSRRSPAIGRIQLAAAAAAEGHE